MFYMQTGIIKWYSPLSKVGFISPAKGGEDVFFHHAALTFELTELVGTTVAYEDEHHQRGPHALHIEHLQAGHKEE